MTQFIDGPAQGKTLMLQRAPHYLRVVIGGTGEVDALDQLDDTPLPTETLYAYEMVGEPSFCHVQRIVNGRRAGGCYRGGRYRIVSQQPTEAQMRSSESWREWVSAQIGKPVNDDGTVNP